MEPNPKWKAKHAWSEITRAEPPKRSAAERVADCGFGVFDAGGRCARGLRFRPGAVSTATWRKWP
jgi:hypothetical protein